MLGDVAVKLCWSDLDVAAAHWVFFFWGGGVSVSHFRVQFSFFYASSHLDCCDMHSKSNKENKLTKQRFVTFKRTPTTTTLNICIKTLSLSVRN